MPELTPDGWGGWTSRRRATPAPPEGRSDAEWQRKDRDDRRAHREEEARDRLLKGLSGFTNLHDTADLLRHLREDHAEAPDPAASHSKLWQQHYSLHFGPGADVPFENWSTTHHHTEG